MSVHALQGGGGVGDSDAGFTLTSPSSVIAACSSLGEVGDTGRWGGGGEEDSEEQEEHEEMEEHEEHEEHAEAAKEGERETKEACERKPTWSRGGMGFVWRGGEMEGRGNIGVDRGGGWAGEEGVGWGLVDWEGGTGGGDI